MKPSHYTTSYNATFRPADNTISPHVGEGMYHFTDRYDPSHYQRDPGFYGVRATLAAEAKQWATQNGVDVRVPRQGDGPVGYGEAPRKAVDASLSPSFYRPGADPKSQNYSALKQNAQRPGEGTLMYQAGSSPASSNGSGSPSFSGSGSGSFGHGSGSFSPSHTTTGVHVQTRVVAPTYGDKDLWNHPTLPHGDPRSYSNAPISMTETVAVGTANGRFGTTAQNTLSYGGSTPSPSKGAGAGSGGLYDPSFTSSSNPSDWRYDGHGVAMSKNVELRRNTDPRAKFHIPGYSGYVRGKQFMHGDTFAKTTRACLDVPMDLPTDI